MTLAIVDRIRDSCRWVAGRARHVRIHRDAIPAYAASLARSAPPADPIDPLTPDPADPLTGRQREHEAAFWLTMDAINFGSGWFPTLRKDPGRSGYHTIHRALRDRFDQHGPWSALELSRITPAQLAGTLAQDPNHELMALFATSLQDLGRHLHTSFGGSFTAPVDQAAGRAVDLVEMLSTWPCFADTSTYAGREVPFLKRAQIAAADLHRATVARFADLGRLTMFADNLVPHVLRLDGILEFDRDLVTRIERGALIQHDSPEEVEIRACALHAVELIVASLAADHRPLRTAAEIDQTLWERGQQPRYKAAPRHRSRCTAY